MLINILVKYEGEHTLSVHLATPASVDVLRAHDAYGCGSFQDGPAFMLHLHLSDCQGAATMQFASVTNVGLTAPVHQQHIIQTAHDRITPLQLTKSVHSRHRVRSIIMLMIPSALCVGRHLCLI